MTLPFDTLAARPTLDHETMWRYMRLLLDRLFGVLDSDAVMDDSLDILVELLGADRVSSSRRNPTARHTSSTRADTQIALGGQREEVSKTVIREALDTGRCIVLDPKVTKGPSSSVMVLGIVVALAAPFHSGVANGRVRGMVYVDVRDRRKFIGERHIEFFMSASILLGAVLEQHGRAQTERTLLREARAHCMDVRHSRRCPIPGRPSLRPRLRSSRR